MTSTGIGHLEAARSVQHLTTGELLAELVRRGTQQANPSLAETVRSSTARALVEMVGEMFAGSAVAKVARTGGVAVSWHDRYEIEQHLEVAFTDEQWARISGRLEDFDEWLSMDTHPIWDFVDHCLDRAGLVFVDESESPTGEPMIAEESAP